MIYSGKVGKKVLPTYYVVKFSHYIKHNRVYNHLVSQNTQSTFNLGFT